MKNLYLIETNAYIMAVMHDTEEKTATVLDTEETNTPGFTLAQIEDMSAGNVFDGVEDIEHWLGVDYNKPDATKIIETIENWEGWKMKYYAIIDTFLKRIDLYATIPEASTEYLIRKAVDRSMSFAIGEHCKLVKVNALQKVTENWEVKKLGSKKNLKTHSKCIDDGYIKLAETILKLQADSYNVALSNLAGSHATKKDYQRDYYTVKIIENELLSDYYITLTLGALDFRLYINMKRKEHGLPLKKWIDE